jgi:hypothetical protein
MSDIFISYSHEDRLRAEELARALGGRGWSIFWDQTIPIGKTWPETIGRELSEARCVIVLWSKTSVESGWVREEANDAKERHILVPVLIDSIRPPVGFRGIQTADLVNWNATKPTPALDLLTANIAELIGVAPRMGAPPPPLSPNSRFPAQPSPERMLSAKSLGVTSPLIVYMIEILASLAPIVGFAILMKDADAPRAVTLIFVLHAVYGVISAAAWLHWYRIDYVIVIWIWFCLFTYAVLSLINKEIVQFILVIVAFTSVPSAALCVASMLFILRRSAIVNLSPPTD